MGYDTLSRTGLHLKTMAFVSLWLITAVHSVWSADTAWFLGEWHISSFKMPGMAALDSAEATGWIGKNVKVSAKTFVFDTDTCTPVEYEPGRRDAIAYFSSIYRISPMDLDIAQSTIEVIDIRCGTRVRQSLFSTDGKKLWIDYNGVFFLMDRGKGAKRVVAPVLSYEAQLALSHGKAKALAQSAAFERAADLMAEAVGGPPWQIDKDNVAAFDDYGYYLLKAGRFQAAADIIMSVLAAFPERTAAYLNLGDAYTGLGNAQQATVSYQAYCQLMEQAGKKKLIPPRALKALQ